MAERFSATSESVLERASIKQVEEQTQPNVQRMNVWKHWENLKKFGFNCIENYRFLWRNITADFRNKGTDLLLLFPKGQICRLECKIRPTSIFGQPLAARKFGG